MGSLPELRHPTQNRLLQLPFGRVTRCIPCYRLQTDNAGSSLVLSKLANYTDRLSMYQWNLVFTGPVLSTMETPYSFLALALSLCDSSLQQQSRSLVNICKFDMRYSLSWSPISAAQRFVSARPWARIEVLATSESSKLRLPFHFERQSYPYKESKTTQFVSLCIRFECFLTWQKLSGLPAKTIMSKYTTQFGSYWHIPFTYVHALFATLHGGHSFTELPSPAEQPFFLVEEQL